MNRLAAWWRERFKDPQVLMLVVLLVLGVVAVLLIGDLLMPVLAALVLAYLLEAVVMALVGLGLKRWLAVAIVFIGFLAATVITLVGLIPPLLRQSTQLLAQTPELVSAAGARLQELPERYPQFLSQAQINDAVAAVSADIAGLGQQLLGQLLTSAIGIVTWIIYLVLVPVLVFFFLKDKKPLQRWFAARLPDDRELAHRVWSEVDLQLGNYVRGKALEILIVGITTFITFKVLGLQFAILLATMVGLSVLIPYIGAAAVTVPVAFVAYYQFGFSSAFWTVLTAYLIIQILDGNVLVPLLFGEVVNLHPIAIIVAVLVFGGIWGFWGVFFAIPLAILANAVLEAISPQAAVDVPEAA